MIIDGVEVTIKEIIESTLIANLPSLTDEPEPDTEMYRKIKALI